MAYSKTNWVNDTTELSAENMNHIEDGIEQAYGQLLLAVDSEAPEECVIGDKYYNTETNKIYTATATDTWGTTGVDAELGVFYIVLETQNIYTYNGETLISVGGGAGGGDATPIGTVEAYAGSTAPDGYLFCDGSAVSRETYKDLYRVIGTTYGTGDGSTTFNLPNIKGRVVVMLDSTQTEFDTLGETGGEKTHTLTVNELPMDVGLLNNLSNTLPKASIGSATSGWGYNANREINANYQQPHNNLQPYIVLNYIIKAQKLAGTVLSEQLPIGTEVDFDGTSADIPIGWEQVNNVLWTNPNPTSSFSEQNITLSNSNYDYYKIIATNDINYNSNYVIVEGIKGKGCYLMIPNSDGTTTRRLVNYVNDTTLQITNVSGSSTVNGLLVPLKVMGYK